MADGTAAGQAAGPGTISVLTRMLKAGLSSSLLSYADAIPVPDEGPVALHHHPVVFHALTSNVLLPAVIVTAFGELRLAFRQWPAGGRAWAFRRQMPCVSGHRPHERVKRGSVSCQSVKP